METIDLGHDVFFCFKANGETRVVKMLVFLGIQIELGLEKGLKNMIYACLKWSSFSQNLK